jgi:hypothetical protein
VILGIDHLVIAARDPASAAEAIGTSLGLAFTGGGRHESAGTFNRLAFLGDTYLELIGVFDAELARSPEASPVSRVTAEALASGREGLVSWALASDSIERDVASLRAAGSGIGAPVPGSRRRDDGEVVRWRCAFPERGPEQPPSHIGLGPEQPPSHIGLGPEQPPFLIEHDPTGSEWGDAARVERARFLHPVGGAIRLVTLHLPVSDPAAAAAAIQDTAGLAAGSDGSLSAGGHIVRLFPGDPRRDPAIVTMRLETTAARPEAARDRTAIEAGVRWQLVGAAGLAG